MPPSIPGAPLRSLSSTLLPSTTTPSATLIRTFGTTPSRSNVEIPPESPRFISLPDLPQSTEDKQPPLKGHLPVPREIFTRRTNMAHKIAPTFIEDTVPRSKAELAGLPPKSEKDSWKRLMAESRRTALASGIDSLWKRKRSREKREKSRADGRLRQNLEDARAPERPDEVFTRGTVTQATLNTTVIRDPEYAPRQLMSQQRTAAINQAKSEARKDSVQRLYVEAGRFILTEEELAKKVNDIFVENRFHSLASGGGTWWGAENMWEAYGPPIKVADMFADMRGTSHRVSKAYQTASNKTAQRQKVVAGELTGGALSVTDIVD